MMSEESEEVHIKDIPPPSETDVVIETSSIETESKEISLSEVEIGSSEIVDSELIIGDQTVIVEGEVSADEVNEKSTEDEINKTEETEEHEDAQLESPVSKPNRELKLLLELSKEANLDTNIAYKRKSLDPNKHIEHQDHRYASMPISDGKRSMRSQNPEFVVKHQKFLSKLSSDGGEVQTTSDNEEKSIKDKGEKSTKDKGDKTPKKKEHFPIGGAIDENTKKLLAPAMALIENHKDGFCWRCHREGVNISCETCPRSYHLKCLKHSNINTEHWVCPECVIIINAENTKTRSSALKDLSLEQLCDLLKFALKRMEKCNESDPFLHSVKEDDFPDYKKYIVEPMDLDRMQRNIRDKLYGSTNAFEADAKWLLHNSIIFNSYQSKLTTVAKTILKVCKQEMSEIENCPTCYLNANTKNNWFTEVCPKPHLLLWAKLKGFPYWPAKAMSTNSQGMVDVRFFGAHDRAWVPVRECFLYSLKDPNPHKHMKNDIIECIKEVDVHIENLKKVYGDFIYAPYRTPYDPENETQQLQLLLSSYSSTHRRTTPPRKFLKIDNLLKRRSTLDKPSIEKSQKQRRTSGSIEAASNENKTDNKEIVGYGTDEEIDNDDEMSIEGSVTDGINGQEQNRLNLVNSNVKSTIISKRKRSRSRRNSDQSTKSDASRISSISDKINTVDISENMEVSLANEVINIKVAENVAVEKTNSIESKNPSPNTLKISDKLMKKLSNTNLNKENKKAEVDEIMNDNRVQIDSVEDTEMNIIESESRPSISDIKQILGLPPEDISTKKENVSENISVTANDKKNEITTGNSKSEPTKSKGVLTKLSPTKSSSEATKSSSEATKSKSELTQSKLELTKSKLEFTKSKSEHVKSKLELSKSKSESTKSKAENIEKLTVLPSEKIKEPVENSSNTVSSTTIDTSVENNLPVDDLLEEMYSEAVDVAGTSQNRRSPLKIKSKELPQNKVSNKRKAPDENQNESPIHNKFIKLVDINAITGTSSEAVTSTPTKKSILKNRLTPTKSKEIEQPIVENVISKKPEGPVVENKTQNNTPDTIEIKSEPSSDTENDNANMEAKKQYLSALNISEKIAKINKPLEKEKMKTRTDVAKAIEKPGVVRRKSTEPTLAADNQRNTLPKFIKQLPPKQRARKTFPRRSSSSPKPITKNDTLRVTKIINSAPPARISTQESQHSNNVVNSSTNTKNLMILTQPSPAGSTLTVLPTSQTIAYTGSIGNPLFPMVQPTSFGNFMVPTTAMTPVPPLNPILDRNVSNIVTSQVDSQTSIDVNNLVASANAIFTSTGQQLSLNASTLTLTTSVTTVPIASVASTSNNSGNVTILNGQTTLPNASTPNRSIAESNDEFGYLYGYISENVTKSITDLIHRAPPKLKPRPPGPLSNSFDSGLPSSAGRATSAVNSMAHKLTDYFRGMLIETLNDLGTMDNADALITGLRLENEKLKHRHAEEVLEIKKNVNSILKDIQKSIIDERERVIEETKAACEAETIRRIDEAKSKQWCANCMKEAQFYCCWNTSYCDYPCQLKHWPKHTSRCTQNANTSQSDIPNMAKLVTPLILRKTSAPPKGVFTQKQIGNKPQTKEILSKPSPNRSSTTVKTSTVNKMSFMHRKIKSVSVVTPTSQQNVSGKSSSPSQTFVVPSSKSKTTMEID